MPAVPPAGRQARLFCPKQAAFLREAFNQNKPLFIYLFICNCNSMLKTFCFRLLGSKHCSLLTPASVRGGQVRSVGQGFWPSPPPPQASPPQENKSTVSSLLCVFLLLARSTSSIFLNSLRDWSISRKQLAWRLLGKAVVSCALLNHTTPPCTAPMLMEIGVVSAPQHITEVC